MSPRNLFTYEMRRTSAIKFNIERKTLRTNLTRKLRPAVRPKSQRTARKPSGARCPIALTCCALTANRNRKRSVIVCGCDPSQNLTFIDRARPLLAAMASSGAMAGVDGSSTATHGAGHVSDAIGAAHGEPSKSNPATGHATARRAGP